jgi:hypothetical protein
MLNADREDTVRQAILLMVGLLWLAACTTSTITPQVEVKPTQAYQTIALGDVDVADKIWAPQVEHFRRAFIARLKESNAFATVTEQPPATPAAGVLTVSGQITEIDKGSRALRAIVGFGAGRARAQGDFKITDANGAVLASFTSAKAYSGGAGIGGFDLVDIDDLMEKFGSDTADAVVHWSKGEPLDQ